MAQFRLVYTPVGGGSAVDRTIQAPSLEQAYEVAADVVAEAHQMPGEHVAFDRAGRRLTIGAGYRSRRGSFSLEPLAS